MLGNTGPVIVTSTAKVTLPEDVQLDTDGTYLDVNNDTSSGDDEVLINRDMYTKKNNLVNVTLFEKYRAATRNNYANKNDGNVVDFLTEIKVQGKGSIEVDSVDCSMEYRYIEASDGSESVSKEDYFKMVNSSLSVNIDSVAIDGEEIEVHTAPADLSATLFFLKDNNVTDEISFDTEEEQSIPIGFRLIIAKPSDKVTYNNLILYIKSVSVTIQLKADSGETSSKSFNFKANYFRLNKLADANTDLFIKNQKKSFYSKSMQVTSVAAETEAVLFVIDDVDDTSDGIKVQNVYSCKDLVAYQIYLYYLFEFIDLNKSLLLSSVFTYSDATVKPMNIYLHGVNCNKDNAKKDSAQATIHYSDLDNNYATVSMDYDTPVENIDIKSVRESFVSKLKDDGVADADKYRNITIIVKFETSNSPIYMLSKGEIIGYMATYNRVGLDSRILKNYEVKQNSYGGVQSCQFVVAVGNGVIAGLSTATLLYVAGVAPFCAIPMVATIGFTAIMTVTFMNLLQGLVITYSLDGPKTVLRIASRHNMRRDPIQFESLVSQLNRTDNNQTIARIRDSFKQSNTNSYKLNEEFNSLNSMEVSFFLAHLRISTVPVYESNVLNAYNPRTVNYDKVTDPDEKLILTDEIAADIHSSVSSVTQTNIGAKVPISAFDITDTIFYNPSTKRITPAQMVDDDKPLNYLYLVLSMIQTDPDDDSTKLKEEDFNNKYKLIEKVKDYYESEIKDKDNQVLERAFLMTIDFLETSPRKVIEIPVKMLFLKATRRAIGSFGPFKLFLAFNVNKDKLIKKGGILFGLGEDGEVDSTIVKESGNILIYQVKEEDK